MHAHHVMAPPAALFLLVLMQPSGGAQSGSRRRADDDACALFGESHVLCRFREGQVGEACHRYGNPLLIQVSVTPHQQEQIVSIHNKWRRIVALGKTRHLGNLTASNMRRLTWDSDLARISSRLVDQCTAPECNVSSCRRSEKFTTVGQNVAISVDDFEDILDSHLSVKYHEILDEWFQEIGSVRRCDIDSFPYGQIGRFTQAVWANTFRVGCGTSVVPVAYNQMQAIVICSYGPSGNVVNEPTFLVGPPASECPPSTVPNTKTGLCD